MRRILIAIAMLSTLAVVPAAACGPGGSTRGGMASEPPIALLLDAELTTAKLSDADMATLKSMRAQIAKLETKNREAACEVEEKAMLMLGHRKAWTARGPGSFLWTKLPSKTS